MDAKTRRPFTCTLGLALGEVHWDLAAGAAADPAFDAAFDADAAGGRPMLAWVEPPRPAVRPEPARRLPLSDVDLHVTGERGSPPDALRSLAALLRRILASGRERPDPVEQDYVTGYLRQLLLVPSSPFFLDPLQLKTELNCAYLNSDAAHAT